MRMSRSLSISLLCSIILIPALLFSQKKDTTQIKVKKTMDFSVTGKGNASNWNEVDWLTITPRDKDIYQTKLKLLYSDSGIYCLFHCEDKKITATMNADNMDLWHEDVVEAFFWTDEKFPVYFEYELSPLNYELPIMVPNNKGNFLGWLPWHYEGNRRIKHATFIEKDGENVVSWTAEFYIPFVLLRPLSNVPPKKGTKWRANFYRIDYDKGAVEWSWQLTKTSFHDYERFGTLVFE